MSLPKGIAAEDLEPLGEHPHHRFRDLTGRRFGRLTVIVCRGLLRQPAFGRVSVWHCECDCGGFTLVRGNSLTSGQTRSCGCLYRDTRVTKGSVRMRSVPREEP